MVNLMKMSLRSLWVGWGRRRRVGGCLCLGVEIGYSMQHHVVFMSDNNNNNINSTNALSLFGSLKLGPPSLHWMVLSIPTPYPVWELKCNTLSVLAGGV